MLFFKNITQKENLIDYNNFAQIHKQHQIGRRPYNMETKKKKNANLERQRGLFLQIAFVIVLSLLLLVIEKDWIPEQKDALASENFVGIDVEIEKYYTKTKKILQPPVPNVAIEYLVIRENNEEIHNELNFVSMEMPYEMTTNLKLKPEQEEEYIVSLPDDGFSTTAIFAGGEVGLKLYIQKHIRYPAEAKENQIQGKVYVRFKITKEGKIENVATLNKIDPLLDEEALRIVRSLPAWKPAKIGGKPINSWYTVPISFVLQ